MNDDDARNTWQEHTEFGEELEVSHETKQGCAFGSFHFAVKGLSGCVSFTFHVDSSSGLVLGGREATWPLRVQRDTVTRLPLPWKMAC